MKKFLSFALMFSITIFLGGNSVAFSQSESELQFCSDPEAIAILQEMMNGQESSLESQDINSLMRAPAPPLTYVRNYMVKSSAGEEIIEENQSNTKFDHGSNMKITTIQLGFSKTQFAKMAGSIVLGLDKSYIIDVNGDGLGDGMMYIWDASDYKDGVFTYEATSANYPWNKMTTNRLFIR